MDIYKFSDYRPLMRARIELFPRQGYGQLNRLAQALGVQASLISQILSGSKSLNEDQGYTVCQFFGFNERETAYFLLLIQIERAAQPALKKFHQKRLAGLREEAKDLKNRIAHETELTFESQAVYYSNWLYAAVHTLSSIPRYQRPEVMAEHLQLSLAQVNEAAAWLVERGLCKRQGERITVGPLTTFVDKDSPLVTRHHTNWRMKALEHMSRRTDDDFFFTVPFSISEEDYREFRSKIVHLVETLAKTLEQTEPAAMATLNIDFFRS